MVISASFSNFRMPHVKGLLSTCSSSQTSSFLNSRLFLEVCMCKKTSPVQCKLRNMCPNGTQSVAFWHSETLDCRCPAQSYSATLDTLKSASPYSVRTDCAQSDHRSTHASSVLLATSSSTLLTSPSLAVASTPPGTPTAMSAMPFERQINSKACQKTGRKFQVKGAGVGI